MPRNQKYMRTAESGNTVSERLEYYSMPVTECGCFIWIGQVDKRGYGKLWVNGTMKATHRLSWKEANGPIPNKLFVLHKCDTPPCINPDHLFLGTQKDNMRDRDRKGRLHAKLTAGDVREIIASKEKQKILAERYGITQPNVSVIKNGKAWKHVI